MPHTGNYPVQPDNPFTLAPTLVFSPVITESIAPVLFEMDSSEAVFFLTPILGPTSICLMHMLTAWCKEQAAHDTHEFEITLDHLGMSLGISTSTLLNTLQRLHRFNFIHPVAGVPLRTEVQTEVRYYAARWLKQLPTSAADALIDWQRTLGVPA